MPRPRIHKFWDSRIRSLHEENQDWSAAAIGRALQKVAKDAPTVPPSNRAVLRVMTESKDSPEEERIQFRYFRWPESMSHELFPWDASRACLDLLSALVQKHGAERPLNAVARMFWRVTQATPDVDDAIALPLRFALTVRFLIFGMLRDTATDPEGRAKYEGRLRRCEMYLAAADWARLRRDLPALDLTADELAKGDAFQILDGYARVCAEFDPEARALTRRMRKGAGDRIPQAPPEDINPADFVHRSVAGSLADVIEKANETEKQKKTNSTNKEGRRGRSNSRKS